MKNDSEQKEMARVIAALESAVAAMADRPKRERIALALQFWREVGFEISVEERADMLAELGYRLKVAAERSRDAHGSTDTEPSGS